MIPVAQPTFVGNELKYVKQCFDSNWIAAGGNFVKEFEEKFSAFSGCKHGVAASSGTTALHLTLLAAGIKPGDEIIVPDLTFAASANCVLHSYAKPVLVDVDKTTWTINPELIEEKITDKTKAIIPVHLYGHPADMDPVNKIAKDHGLLVIEDACPAHGSKYKGKPVGGLGDMACFSFHASKLITTGEGGMLTTSNPEYDDTARLFRDQGMRKPKYYWHPVAGYNYRLTNIQAAIGVAQFEGLEEKIRDKEKQTLYYHGLLKEVPGITVPSTSPDVERVLPFLVVLVEPEYGMTRDELAVKLREKGVETRPVFYPLHTMPPYEAGRQEFPVASEIAGKGIQLPSSLNLSNEQINSIVDHLKALKAK